jgi:hypothetical protein
MFYMHLNFLFSVTLAMSNKDKYSDVCVRYGFTCTTEKDGLQRLQCVLCSLIFWTVIPNHRSCQNISTNRSVAELMYMILTHWSLRGHDFITAEPWGRLDLCHMRSPPYKHPIKLHICIPWKRCFIQQVRNKRNVVHRKWLKIALRPDARQKLQQAPLSNDVIHSRILETSQDTLQ